MFLCQFQQSPRAIVVKFLFHFTRLRYCRTPKYYFRCYNVNLIFFQHVISVEWLSRVVIYNVTQVWLYSNWHKFIHAIYPCNLSMYLFVLQYCSEITQNAFETCSTHVPAAVGPAGLHKVRQQSGCVPAPVEPCSCQPSSFRNKISECVR